MLLSSYVKSNMAMKSVMAAKSANMMKERGSPAPLPSCRNRMGMSTLSHTHTTPSQVKLFFFQILMGCSAVQCSAIQCVQ